MQKLQEKFIKAIDNGRIKLEPWKRDWYNYIIDIQELVWWRNLIDGYNIYIYDKNMHQIAEMTIDNNLGKINFNIV